MKKEGKARQNGLKKGMETQDGMKKKRPDGFKNRKRKQDGEDMKKDMDLILADPRFAHVASDLKLRHVPKEERRVKLDSRFHSVLTDDKFYEKSTMDPRGRKGNYSTKEDLLKFYELSSEEDTDDEKDEEEEEEEEEEDEEEEEEEGDEEEEKDGGVKSDEDSKEDDDEEEDGERDEEEEEPKRSVSKGEGKQRLKNKTLEPSKMEGVVGASEEVLKRVENMSQDFARGEVFFSDDSSDDDSSTDDESEENLPEFEWGELDQDAVWDNEQEVEETSRFAVCNLDWDRVNANDIMILFTSFCPRGGSVIQVTIYPSEYGKQRLAEEEVKGPQELRRTCNSDIDPDLVDLEKLEKGKLDQSAGATKGDYEALRRYQRNRLRYYYAVVECDSVDTARIIYNECDRKPYEGAGFLLDLRYIPEDMTFDETPHDVCQKVPESYEVKSFTTTALHDTRPVLTWDETDPERQKALSSAMTQALKGSQIEDDCLRNFIAASSDEESEDACVKSDGSDSDDDVTKASRIAKFRALISEIDEKERRKQERDKDLEETFDLGEDKDDNSESDDVEDEEEEESEKKTKSDDKTPFDKYLEKRKAKRKARIERKKMEKRKAQEDSDESSDNESDDQISDDDLPEGAGDIYNDPFFSEELKKMKNSSKKDKKNSKTKSSSQKIDDGDNANDQGNLELLLMDEDAEDKKHFNMREIIETNKEKKKKGRKKKLKKKEENLPLKQESKSDDFKVNMSDPRFSVLLTSGDYNIDPSHPQFKHTKAMDSLIDEMQKKRVAESFEEVPDSKRSRPEGRSSLELSALVKKVKSKAKKPIIKQ